MKDLKYYKDNCEEDSLHTPISVLRYITELEKRTETKPLIIDGVSGSTLTAKEAALDILEWIKSDDCWVTDKDGNKLPDAIIDGKDLNKRLDKYYG